MAAAWRFSAFCAACAEVRGCCWCAAGGWGNLGKVRGERLLHLLEGVDALLLAEHARERLVDLDDLPLVEAVGLGVGPHGLDHLPAARLGEPADGGQLLREGLLRLQRAAAAACAQ